MGNGSPKLGNGDRPVAEEILIAALLFIRSDRAASSIVGNAIALDKPLWYECTIVLELALNQKRQLFEVRVSRASVKLKNKGDATMSIITKSQKEQILATALSLEKLHVNRYRDEVHGGYIVSTSSYTEYYAPSCCLSTRSLVRGDLLFDEGSPNPRNHLIDRPQQWFGVGSIVFLKNNHEKVVKKLGISGRVPLKVVAIDNTPGRGYEKYTLRSPQGIDFCVKQSPHFQPCWMWEHPELTAITTN